MSFGNIDYILVASTNLKLPRRKWQKKKKKHFTGHSDHRTVQSPHDKILIKLCMVCVYVQRLTCECFSVNWATWPSVFSSCESNGCKTEGLAHTPFSAVFSELCSGGEWHSEERQPISLSVRERIFSHSSSSSRERCLSSAFSCLQVNTHSYHFCLCITQQ